jgi:hypothetical protein
MITDWQRSIVRSCKGRGSYFFERKVFPSDILRLKIEILLVNSSLDNTVITPTVTITYNENIDDEIFRVRVGINKPLGTIIENIKPHPFTVRLDNPNRSPITALLQLPIFKRSSMPFYPEGNDSPVASDPALLAAVQAQATATAQLVATMQAQPSAIADALGSDDINTGDAITETVGTTPKLLSVQNDNNVGLLLNNQGNTKIKLWVTDNLLPASTGYNSNGHFFEMPGKGLYEVPSPFYKSNIYAISSGANGSVSVTKSMRV